MTNIWPILLAVLKCFMGCRPIYIQSATVYRYQYFKHLYCSNYYCKSQCQYFFQFFFIGCFSLVRMCLHSWSWLFSPTVWSVSINNIFDGLLQIKSIRTVSRSNSHWAQCVESLLVFLFRGSSVSIASWENMMSRWHVWSRLWLVRWPQ